MLVGGLKNHISNLKKNTKIFLEFGCDSWYCCGHNTLGAILTKKGDIIFYSKKCVLDGITTITVKEVENLIKETKEDNNVFYFNRKEFVYFPERKNKPADLLDTEFLFFITSGEGESEFNCKFAEEYNGDKPACCIKIADEDVECSLDTESIIKNRKINKELNNLKNGNYEIIKKEDKHKAIITEGRIINDES